MSILASGVPVGAHNPLTLLECAAFRQKRKKTPPETLVRIDDPDPANVRRSLIAGPLSVDWPMLGLFENCTLGVVPEEMTKSGVAATTLGLASISVSTLPPPACMRR